MDESNPKWLLAMYITIAMVFFTAVGYSVGRLVDGIEIGIVASLATCIPVGFKMALDYNASLSWSKKEK